jgi:hypothetical protein
MWAHGTLAWRPDTDTTADRGCARQDEHQRLPCSSGTNASGTLTVKEGTSSMSFTLVGSYTSGNFTGSPGPIDLTALGIGLATVFGHQADTDQINGARSLDELGSIQYFMRSHSLRDCPVSASKGSLGIALIAQNPLYDCVVMLWIRFKVPERQNELMSPNVDAPRPDAHHERIDPGVEQTGRNRLPGSRYFGEPSRALLQGHSVRPSHLNSNFWKVQHKS